MAFLSIRKGRPWGSLAAARACAAHSGPVCMGVRPSPTITQRQRAHAHSSGNKRQGHLPVKGTGVSCFPAWHHPHPLGETIAKVGSKGRRAKITRGFPGLSRPSPGRNQIRNLPEVKGDMLWVQRPTQSAEALLQRRSEPHHMELVSVSTTFQGHIPPLSVGHMVTGLFVSFHYG